MPVSTVPRARPMRFAPTWPSFARARPLRLDAVAVHDSGKMARRHRQDCNMLFEPARHEPLRAPPWSEQRARDAIDWIVRETNAAFVPARYWPTHPKDFESSDDPAMVWTSLYFGAAGVVWALRHLHALGACEVTIADQIDLTTLRDDNRAWLRSQGFEDFGSYLMGDLAIELMAWGEAQSAARADALAWLIDSNIDHPARELMWGSPGSLLAATFLHDRTRDE